jgi:signal transduction histidine kinase
MSRTGASQRPLRYALWPTAFVLGIVASWIGRPELAVLDAVTGFVLLGLGLAAWALRPRWRVGPILGIAGVAWFIGSLWSPAIYLHRGPLAHLLLSYPARALLPTSRLDRIAIGAAYAYAAAYPLAGNDYVTIAFAFGLVALSARRAVVAGPAQRRPRLASLTAATVFGLVLAVAAGGRLAGVEVGRTMLVVYDLSVCLIALGLFADLVWGGWARTTVTGLVVDLGEPATSGTLRDRLAQTLGDPTLVVGYWLPGQGRYADEAGRPLELPVADAERALTQIDEDGRRVAVLIHDRALFLDDPALVPAVASATRMAVSNAHLQAEVRERVAEVEASRRRIVEAADDQRDRLGHELRTGTERRLLRVAELVGEIDPELARQVEAARVELEELALGIHPRTLAVGGVGAALRELAERSPVPVTIVAPTERLTAPLEAAAYFLCSEALANVAKHARASHASIRVTAANELLTVEVADDGVGGAETSAGSGLRGLADRLEALGGQLVVESPRGGGTRLVARLPYTSTAIRSWSTAG